MVTFVIVHTCFAWQAPNRTAQLATAYKDYTVCSNANRVPPQPACTGSAGTCGSSGGK